MNFEHATAQSEIYEAFFEQGKSIAESHFQGKFSESALRTAVRELFETIDTFMDEFQTTTKKYNKEIACRKGCSWCCYQQIYTAEHEFRLLKGYLKKNKSSKVLEQILTKSSQKNNITINLTEKERSIYRTACPLLEKGVCSVYKFRPVACRIYVSSEEMGCKNHKELPKNNIIPALYELPLYAGRYLNQGFIEYLKEIDFYSKEFTLENLLSNQM